MNPPDRDLPDRYHRRTIKMATWGFVMDELSHQSRETGVTWNLSPGALLRLRSHVSRRVEEERELPFPDMVSEPSRTGRKIVRRMIAVARELDRDVLDETVLEETLTRVATESLFPFS